MSSRHLSRIVVMQSLYEWDMRPDEDPMQIAGRNMANFQDDVDRDFVIGNLKGVLSDLSTIDGLIGKAAPEWPLEQVSPIDKSILRLAIYEILKSSDVPPKVVINEAVELGKAYGGDNTGKFVNGVLGTVYRESDRFIEEKEGESERGTEQASAKSEVLSASSSSVKQSANQSSKEKPHGRKRPKQVRRKNKDTV